MNSILMSQTFSKENNQTWIRLGIRAHSVIKWCSTECLCNSELIHDWSMKHDGAKEACVWKCSSGKYCDQYGYMDIGKGLCMIYLENKRQVGNTFNTWIVATTSQGNNDLFLSLRQQWFLWGLIFHPILLFLLQVRKAKQKFPVVAMASTEFVFTQKIIARKTSKCLSLKFNLQKKII